MTTVEILTAAKAKIKDQRHWTKYRFARDHSGEPVNACSINACCWCALGAVMVDHERPKGASA